MGRFKRGLGVMPHVRYAALAGALAVIALPSQAQQAFSNLPAWDGANGITSWGQGITATYGQTFSTGNSLSTLGSFTFYLAQTSGTPQKYQAFVYEWSPGSRRVVGPALYASPVLSAPSGGAYTPVTINTGGVGLVPGKTYVMFFTISGLPAQANGAYTFGAILGSNSSPSGRFVFFNNNDLDFSRLQNSSWNILGADQDLAMALGFGPGSMAAPLFNAGLNAITLNAMRDVNRVVQARLDGETGLSAGDSFQGNGDGWMKPYGGLTDQNAREGFDGYRVRTQGVAFGVERGLSRRSTVGLAAALGEVRVNSRAPSTQEATIQTYTLIGYGRHGVGERIDLTWQLDGGVTDNRGARHLDFLGGGNTANSRFKALTAHAGTALTRSYAIGADTTFSPALRADYAVIRSNGYNEEGGGGLGLAVRSAVTQELILGVDARFARKINARSTLTANLGLGYDVLNQRDSVSAAYLVGTDDIRFTGLRRSPLLLRGGVGVDLHRVGRTQVTLRYDVELRESFLNQTASANMRVPF
ncbi:MAG TPA: autotransporter outer membrane beta-barrel domain-containing protein [Burkholderiales bacterium]